MKGAFESEGFVQGYELILWQHLWERHPRETRGVDVWLTQAGAGAADGQWEGLEQAGAIALPAWVSEGRAFGWG